MANQLVSRIAFSALKGITPKLGREFLGRCGSEDTFFSLPESTLTAMMGFKSRLFDDAYRQSVMEMARREVAFVDSNSISTFYFTDDEYPRRLLECDDAPVMLYGLGHCDLNDSRLISVVGTRHATVYGQEMTSRIVSGMAERMTEKPVVVSGLAFGIDIAAHRAAMEAGAPTVAVLAHGLNTIYPAAHRQAAADIARKGGLLLTDYRSTDAIHRGNFLARNRIVAGLSDCLLVTESAAKGGALVTARLAADYGRDVFAVPGRVGDRYSEGCNALIARQVAQLVTSADDILESMLWPTRKAEGAQASLFHEFLPEEEAVIAVLREIDGAQFSQILSKVHLPVARLMGLLVDMEFKGYVMALPGGRYRVSV